MSSRNAAIVAAVAVLFVACAAAAAAGQDARPRSVWDGVYTVEQARRGEQLAAAQCASCHGERLAGAEAAPPLAGPLFNATWEGVMLSDLLDRMRTTMPLDKPGSLSRPQNADLLAYMLSAGGFPAGDTPLPADSGPLGRIRFDTFKPEP